MRIDKAVEERAGQGRLESGMEGESKVSLS